MLNKVIIIGRLTADPELKKTANGTEVCTVRIAVPRKYDHTKADFIPVVFWRSMAEFVVRYFRKGNRIAVEGALQSRSYDDRDGNKRTAYEVVADNVDFVDAKSAGEPENTSFESVDEEADLPWA